MKHSCGSYGRPVLLLASWALLLMSCEGGARNKGKKIFNLNLSSGYLESMDPAYAKDLNMMWIDRMVYNTLVETDEQLRTVPSLAKSWDVSADGLCYTFHLRGDVYFHDNPLFDGGRGRKMTAGDVVYSYSRIMDPAIASPGAWIFNGRVDTAQPFAAPNDSTFVIRLARPFRPLPRMLCMPYCNIVPREVAAHWGKDFRDHPCGTGPFMFTYWDEDNALGLQRNPHYWEYDSAGRRLPYLDAVQVTFIDSKATEFQLFLQGKTDLVNGVNSASKDIILSKNGELKDEYRGSFTLAAATYLNVEYIGFLTDTTNPIMRGQPTANVLVRRAINYAIDRSKIVTYFRNGMGEPATRGFIPAGMPGYDSHAGYGYHYDLQKARQLLAEAGYPDGKGLGPITILTPNNYEDIVNFIVGELREAGITARLELIQPNVLKQQMSASRAVCFRGQWLADYPDAETYLVFFNSRFPAPPNYTRFSDTTFDRWYDESMNLPDSAREIAYRRMDSLVMSYAPIIPLYYEKMLHLTRNDITGLRYNPMNLIDLRYVNKDPVQ
jgi:oligopeptide transport system substrate-binding protein